MRDTILSAIAALALAACASTQAQEPRATPAPKAGQAAQPKPAHGGMMGEGHKMHGGMMGCSMANDCPMLLEGTTLKAADVEGGASLTFTTTGDVAALRERVHKLAEMHTHGCPMQPAQDPDGHAPPHEGK